MYAAVPSSTPGVVFAPPISVSALLSDDPVRISLPRPKSSTFTRRSGVIMMFDGFRSRWMMPAGVRARQRIRDLIRRLRRHGHGRHAPAEHVVERLALDVLHRDVVDAVALADVVDDDNVGVIEARSEPGLALETGEPLGVAAELGRQHLQRDGPIEPRIARAIDLAHAAASEDAGNLIHADTCARGQ